MTNHGGDEETDDIFRELEKQGRDETAEALYVVPDLADVEALKACGILATYAAQPAQLLNYASEALEIGAPAILIGNVDGGVRDWIIDNVPGLEIRSMHLPPTVTSVAAFLGHDRSSRWDAETIEAKRETWYAWADSARTEIAPIDIPRTGGEACAPPLFPMELVEGEDMVSVLTREIVRTAIIAQPALALGSVIAMLGALLGRTVRVGSLRTNVYCVAVAGTTCGKDHPRTVVSEWMTLTAPEVGQTREFMSGTGVYSLLRNSPSALATVDEFGMVLQAATNIRASSHQRAIATALLTMFSSAGSVVHPASYADTKANPPTPLVEPCLSMIGYSTPDTLAKAVSSGQVADGLLGRILAFVGDDKASKRKDLFRRGPELDQTGPDCVGMLKQLRRTVVNQDPGALPDVNARAGSRCRELWWTGVAADYLETCIDIEAERKKDRQFGELWGRFVEHVQKVALIRAVACDPTTDQIGLGHVEWASKVVSYSMESLISFLCGSMADNDHEAATKRVLRLIAEAGKRGLSQNDVTRRTQWLRGHERRDILDTLMDSGQITTATIPSPRGGRPVTRIFATADRPT